MENYVFVCIGTNKLIEDSFGPRVGDILQKQFKENKYIEVWGTMNSPIHFQNAPIFLDYLNREGSKTIIIDSALGEENLIGNSYLNRGGIEIGKAFGKSLYFPAQWNIKTIVGTNKNSIKMKETTRAQTINQFEKITRRKKLDTINQIAQKLAKQIVDTIYAINE